MTDQRGRQPREDAFQGADQDARTAVARDLAERSAADMELGARLDSLAQQGQANALGGGLGLCFQDQQPRRSIIGSRHGACHRSPGINTIEK